MMQQNIMTQYGNQQMATTPNVTRNPAGSGGPTESDPSTGDDLTPFDSISNGPMTSRHNRDQVGKQAQKATNQYPQQQQYRPPVVRPSAGNVQSNQYLAGMHPQSTPVNVHYQPQQQVMHQGQPLIGTPQHQPQHPMMVPMMYYPNQAAAPQNQSQARPAAGVGTRKLSKAAPKWLADEEPKIGGQGTLMERVKQGRPTPQVSHDLVGAIATEENHDKGAAHDDHTPLGLQHPIHANLGMMNPTMAQPMMQGFMHPQMMGAVDAGYPMMRPMNYPQMLPVQPNTGAIDDDDNTPLGRPAP